MTQEYLFYDLETWGLDTYTSRLVEIAWQRTDVFFQPLEPAVNLVCKPPPECVPQPDAFVVHNKSPQWAMSNGLPEYQFARRIWDEFNRPNTCVIGYNNIRFDDECLRHLFYRNLLEPYTHQYKNGNSRWDLLDLVRLAFGLRPNLLSWPEGRASLKLEDMARENNCNSGRSHEASSDVAATIGLAKKMLQGNPRMVEFAYSSSRQSGLKDALSKFLGGYCLHVSGKIPLVQGHISLVYLVCRNPHNSKQVYAVDLNVSIDMLLEESSEQLREMLFSKREEFPADTIVPAIKTIHLNRAPLLLDPKLLTTTRAEELGINLEMCLSQYAKLKAYPTLNSKLIDVFDTDKVFANQTFGGSIDADLMLYDRFVPAADRRLADQLHRMAVDDWQGVKVNWQDERLDILWLRLLGRMLPESLTSEQSKQWNKYLRDNWSGQISDRSASKVESLLRANELLVKHPDIADLIEYLEQHCVD